MINNIVFASLYTCLCKALSGLHLSLSAALSKIMLFYALFFWLSNIFFKYINFKHIIWARKRKFQVLIGLCALMLMSGNLNYRHLFIVSLSQLA